MLAETMTTNAIMPNLLVMLCSKLLQPLTPERARAADKKYNIADRPPPKPDSKNGGL